MSCGVCRADGVEPHFGALCCRACAAFFRRYYHSKKTNYLCTCKHRFENSHPCRECRIQKCLSIGMDPKKVQKKREKHGHWSDSSSPLALQTRIISRETPNISSAVANWSTFEQKRSEICGGKVGSMSMFEMTSSVKTDMELIWQVTGSLFPEMDSLSCSDKSALLANFVPKWWQIEPLLHFQENREMYESLSRDEYENLVVAFYESYGARMPRREIIRIFEPFWWFYYAKMVLPIAEIGLDKAEFMSIFWLLFFDNAYTNLSPECLKMCHNTKKVILRELRNHQVSKQSEEMRFFETLESLSIIERGEMKFQEEMLICEMHNVQVHEDFKKIMKEPRY